MDHDGWVYYATSKAASLSSAYRADRTDKESHGGTEGWRDLEDRSNLSLRRGVLACLCFKWFQEYSIPVEIKVKDGFVRKDDSSSLFLLVNQS